MINVKIGFCQHTYNLNDIYNTINRYPSIDVFFNTRYFCPSNQVHYSIPIISSGNTNHLHPLFILNNSYKIAIKVIKIVNSFINIFFF